MNENRKETEQYNPISHLKDLRGWSDDIPEEILKGGAGNDSPKFKVRVNWWQGIISDIDDLVGGVVCQKIYQMKQKIL